MVIGIDASRANQQERTGTEWYAWHLLHELPALLPQDRLRLYVREPLMADLQQLGPNVEVRVLNWPPGVLWSHLRLSWEMLWDRPDILFVPANTVPVVHPARTVTTIHDVAFERFPELYRGRSVQRRLGWLRPLIHFFVRLFTLGRYSASERDYHRWSSRQAVRSSQIILTVSEFSKREIVETLGADPSKIIVTPLGVSQPDEYNRLPADDTIQRLGLTRPFFLFLGRLELKKNIDTIVAAYRRYRETTAQPIDLVLAGQPGYGWEKIAPQVTDLMEAGVVHQLGWVGPAERMTLQRQARVFLFVSRYEGFGLPPLESMSAGVPVIASTAGSLPEILGPAAKLVRPDDVTAIAAAMERLSVNQADRQRLITSGLSWVRQYTWRRTAELTVAQLRALA